MRAPPNPREKLSLESTIYIGKKGITDAQIKEIIKQLEARRMVKVKVLRSALTGDTVENIAQRISLETNSKIVQIVGHTFTLYKPKRRAQKNM